MTHADDVLKAVKPVTRTVSICVDGELEDERLRLERQYRDAVKADDDAEDEAHTMQAPALADALADLQARAKDATVDFTFKAIGRKAWTDLMAAHPPTDEQTKDLPEEAVLRWNPLEFPPAAIAASLSEPDGFDAVKVAELEQTLSEGQWKRLWSGCVIANEGVGDVGESSAALQQARNSGQKSGRLPDSEPHDPSS